MQRSTKRVKLASRRGGDGSKRFYSGERDLSSFFNREIDSTSSTLLLCVSIALFGWKGGVYVGVEVQAATVEAPCVFFPTILVGVSRCFLHRKPVHGVVNIFAYRWRCCAAREAR